MKESLNFPSRSCGPLPSLTSGLRGVLPLFVALALLCVSLTAFASRTLAQGVVFVSTGSMTTPRTSHTATLLTNGKVLVAGGRACNTISPCPDLASAELYDPATGTFTPTGSMTTARRGATATLLNNGRVLIAGGGVGSNGSVPSSAELYDPATGTFTPTGSMTTARIYPTATLLNNGKVLVAGGGQINGPDLNSAELYDPQTGTFTATGNMITARNSHTATLLNNGQVLVAGGGDVSLVLNSAELYDPGTGTFTATGSMTTVREVHIANLLSNGLALLAGGEDGFSLLASAELYDPGTETFTATGNMTAVRLVPGAALLINGKVLIAGGITDYNGTVLASADLYDVPAISLSTATIAFGNQTTDTSSAAQSVTLANNQPNVLNFKSIAITGTNAGDFSQSNTCGSSLAPGLRCATSIIFTPSTVGNRSASLAITDDAAGSPQIVSITGTGIAPAPVVSLSPSTLTFPNQPVGTTSASQQVTLTNKGYAALSIASIVVAGTNNTDFAQTNTCSSSVAVGASCTIEVSFTPLAIGNRSASLTIADNATGSSQAVLLGGAGLAPIASLSPTSISFNSAPVGSSSAAQMLTLTNTGTASLTLSSIVISGTNSSDFSQTNNCPSSSSSLASGGSCSISVTFTPAAAGARNASVVVADNAAVSPQIASLAGIGLAPVANFSPSTITFANQYVGTSSLPQSVTLTNVGTVPLNISSVTTTPADFASLSACGSSLGVGVSCAIGVFFDPTVSGARTGTLIISDNATGNSQTVALAGTGQDFAVGAPAPTATVVAGQTASYTVSILPGGGFSQTVSISCAGAPALSTCSVTPSSVTLNGSTSSPVAVTVKTVASSLVSPGFPRAGPQLPPNYSPLLLVLLFLWLTMMAGLIKQRAEHHISSATVSLLALVLCAALTLASCGSGSSQGGGGNPGTRAGAYTLSVSGSFTSGSTTLTHVTNLTLVVQ